MKRYLKYLSYKGIICLSLTLPIRFLYWVALRLADINWAVDKHGRDAVKANLRQILPGASEKRIAYETRWIFRNFGKYLAEFFRFRLFDKRFFEVHTAIRGKEYIDAALAAGKGCIILSAHLSNWEMGAAAMRKYVGYTVNVVTEPHTYAKANDLFVRERAHMDINVIPTQDAPLQVMRALKRNEIVCILGDRDPSQHGVTIDFFGKPCCFPQGPARFAIATGAPIIPGFVLRRTNDNFTVTFEPPIPVPASGTKDEKVHTMIQGYAKKVEEAIRWHPEEWTVFYRVWEETWTPLGIMDKVN
ncbi:MAG: lysophospholipid acyltransferase family protein [Planctomycetes bacterium]|nr:lysophospholipid acyltransferase family protein [Planctomycetota bacterium]